MLIAFIVIGIRLKYKKFVLLTWGFVDISIVTYYIGILLMYLTAMPTDEALELAGFERYASSIVIFAFGCLTMALAWVMDKCLYEKSLVNVMLGLTRAYLINTCTNTRALF